MYFRVISWVVRFTNNASPKRKQRRDAHMETKRIRLELKIACVYRRLCLGAERTPPALPYRVCLKYPAKMFIRATTRKHQSFVYSVCLALTVVRGLSKPMIRFYDNNTSNCPPTTIHTSLILSRITIKFFSTFNILLKNTLSDFSTVSEIKL